MVLRLRIVFRLALIFYLVIFFCTEKGAKKNWAAFGGQKKKCKKFRAALGGPTKEVLFFFSRNVKKKSGLRSENMWGPKIAPKGRFLA